MTVKGIKSPVDPVTNTQVPDIYNKEASPCLRPHLPGSHIECDRNPSALPITKFSNIPPSSPAWKTISAVCAVTQPIMCNYDNSHNWEHIQQVVANADLIYSRELETNKAWTETLDPVLIVLGCILHDVADHKYHKSIPQEGLKDLTLNLLLSCGVEPSLAEKVDIIANNVSYSKERQYAEDIKTILAEHPELAIVQDADRVDALGARGQARCFAYHGADETFRMESMQTSVQHHWEKLCKLPASMKTETGRQLGEDGWKALCWMRRWWDMECGRLERVLG